MTRLLVSGRAAPLTASDLPRQLLPGDRVVVTMPADVRDAWPDVLPTEGTIVANDGRISAVATAASLALGSRADEAVYTVEDDRGLRYVVGTGWLAWKPESGAVAALRQALAVLRQSNAQMGDPSSVEWPSYLLEPGNDMAAGAGEVAQLLAEVGCELLMLCGRTGGWVRAWANGALAYRLDPPLAAVRRAAAVLETVGDPGVPVFVSVDEVGRWLVQYAAADPSRRIEMYRQAGSWL